MVETNLAQLLITIGALFLVAPLLDVLARKLSLPRVTLLLLLGLATGPLVFNVLPDSRVHWFPAVASVALSMVGFLLGDEFTVDNLRARGKPVLLLSSVVTVTTFVFVVGGFWTIGVALPMALILGAAATATDPAACAAVVHESGAEDRPSGRVLLGVVAIDDVWGTLIFAFAMMILGALLDGSLPQVAALEAGREIGGSVLLGVGLGIPVSMVTGRLKAGEPTRLEALGAVLVCTGLAGFLDLSPLLSSIALGAAVANFARHHERSFREVEDIEWPFLIVFFVLSGASADLNSVHQSMGLVAGYVALRVAGRLVGGWVGARLGGLPVASRRWMGAAMLPQAGVALGMTLVAVERFPQELGTALPVIVLATVFFEVVGPLMTRKALSAMA